MKRAGFYASFVEGLLRAEINLLADTIKCLLLAPSYRPDFERQTARRDVAAWEVEGHGYEAGGCELTEKTLLRTAGRVWFTAADLSWPSCRLEAGGLILYQSKTGPLSGHRLICWLEFEDGPVESHGGPFLVEWPEGGIFSPGSWGGTA